MCKYSLLRSMSPSAAFVINWSHKCKKCIMAFIVGCVVGRGVGRDGRFGEWSLRSLQLVGRARPMPKNGCGTLEIPYISVITKRNCWRSDSKFQYSIASFNDFPRSICHSNYERYYASDAPYQTRRRIRRGPRRVGLACRPRRVGRGVGRYAVESAPTFSLVSLPHIVIVSLLHLHNTCLRICTDYTVGARLINQ